LDEIRELMSCGVPEGQHRRRPQQPPQQQDAGSTADASDAAATATATAAEVNSVLGLRSVCWKLLLGYLPTRRAEWQGVPLCLRYFAHVLVRVLDRHDSLCQL
jgi:hypothetical protein